MRRLGWYPLICYDENGDLIPESVTPPKETPAARRRRKKLCALYSVAVDGMPPTLAADQHGFERLTVVDFCREIGIVYLPWDPVRRVRELHPDSVPVLEA